MGLSDIISDSVKYPFSDIQTFLIVGVFSLLAGLSNLLSVSYGVDGMGILVIASIVGLIFALILSGYCLKVVKNAIDYSDALPEFDFVNDLINGIKVLIISIVYFIIPLIIAILFAGVGGLVGASIDHLAASLGFALIIVAIIAIIFAIFEIVALARFANTGQMGDAFSFGEIFEDIKKIGIGRIIGFLLVAIVVMLIAFAISLAFAMIPFVGIIIADIVLGAFVLLFYNRGIGLLYAEAL